MEYLASLFADVQLWVFESILQPIMYATGLASRLDAGFDATGWLMVGVLQLLVMVVLIGPLQRWIPVEKISYSKAVWSDVIYTLIHRLGLFRLALFFTLDPVSDVVFGYLRGYGLPTFQLDDLWPGVTDKAWVSLLLYLLVFDLLNYAIHRAQHHFNWWWSLHALHHSQRQMTMWTDNRNHFLDDVLRDVVIVVFAQLVGIAPGQFVAVVAFTQLCENFQHANVRVWFGAIGERLWISPRFHRLHHSIGIGHESHGRQTLGGHNFGVLLPWWDMLFGTANFTVRFDATGIRDQVEEGVDYGQGIWAQQRLGLQRLWTSLKPVRK